MLHHMDQHLKNSYTHVRQIMICKGPPAMAATTQSAAIGQSMTYPSLLCLPVTKTNFLPHNSITTHSANLENIYIKRLIYKQLK